MLFSIWVAQRLVQDLPIQNIVVCKLQSHMHLIQKKLITLSSII